MISPRIPRDVKRSVRAPIEGMSPRHLDLVCGLHCCRCWAPPPVDAHHLLRVIEEGAKGTGRRHPDKWAIPLCQIHHLAQYGFQAVHFHGDDESFLATFGIDGRALARALWQASPDFDDMNRINLSHYQRALLSLGLS